MMRPFNSAAHAPEPRQVWRGAQGAVLGFYLDGRCRRSRARQAAGLGLALFSYPMLVRRLLGPCLQQYLATMSAPAVAAVWMSAAVSGLRLASHGVDLPSLAVQIATRAAISAGLSWWLPPEWGAICALVRQRGFVSEPATRVHRAVDFARHRSRD